MTYSSQHFELSTPRLTLRRWCSEDSAAAYAFWGDEEVMRYAGGADKDEQASLKSLGIGDKVFLEHGVCLWPVVLKETGELIGCCGFHLGEQPQQLELAYHFKKAHWGKGYATEAALGVLDYARNIWGAQEIIAWAFPENIASWKVLEKIGFQYTGLDQGEKVYRLLCGDLA